MTMTNSKDKIERIIKIGSDAVGTTGGGVLGFFWEGWKELLLAV